MIIVTGGAGFIGSCVVARLNAAERKDILVVDELGRDDKWRNLVGKGFVDFLHKDEFLARIRENRLQGVDAVIHMGACSSTTEKNADYLMENNTRYTETLCQWALERGARFIYASSAATYGDGEAGYSDAESDLDRLRPMNMYGYSKHLFDLRARAAGLFPRIAGLKFFNVYGPNEYHKGDMMSVVRKAHEQIRSTGRVRLFKSYREGYRDGEQVRDFIYVKDCTEVILWLLANPSVNGLFNLGTGRARTWIDLVTAVFRALGREPAIEFIEMPEAIRDRYQYHTEARMEKLAAAGCPVPFHSLEEGIADYVQNHLEKPWPHL